MINWKIVISVLVIVIVGIAVFLFFTSQKTPSATTTTSTSTGFGQPAQYIPISNQSSASPTIFVTSFYSWYLQGIISDSRFVVSDQYKAAIKNWLAPDFIADWNTIVENTNENPVLLAQDYADSWTTHINASVVSQTATTTTVLVSLGIPPNVKKLTVGLIHGTDSTWRIASVTPAP